MQDAPRTTKRNQYIVACLNSKNNMECQAEARSSRNYEHSKPAEHSEIVKTRRWRDKTLPFNLTGVKGQVHSALNRHFIDFILHDNRSAVLRKFFRPTWVADEGFFAILNHNPSLGIPGSYRGLNETEHRIGVENLLKMGTKTSFTRYKQWMFEKGAFCASKRVQRGICLLMTGDLPRLAASPQMFANKFHLHEDRVVVGCLEEMLMNRTLDYFTGHRVFNDSIYRHSDVTTHRLKEGLEGYDT